MSVTRIGVEPRYVAVRRGGTADRENQAQKWTARKTAVFVIGVSSLVWGTVIFATVSFL